MKGAAVPEHWERHHADGDALCRYVRERTGDTVILAFSRGKDAIGAWIQLRRHFERIIPVYRLSVPGGTPLERESLGYYEQFFGAKIHTHTFSQFYYDLFTSTFQTPACTDSFVDAHEDAIWLAQEAHQKERMLDALRNEYGCPGAFVATGVKACDSYRRRMTVEKHGSLNAKDRSFMPVFDWSNDRLADEIDAAGVALPQDYALFGCTLDGISEKWLAGLHEHRPEDFETYCKFYPFAPAILVRHLNNARATGGSCLYKPKPRKP